MVCPFRIDVLLLVVLQVAHFIHGNYAAFTSDLQTFQVVFREL